MWAIDSADGDSLVCGLTEEDVWELAKALAIARGEVVYVYNESGDETEAWTVEP